uniref:Parathyroid hormone n=1 Tax=Anolis carolinensis TaxID=28377 RepID=G1KSU8_ANOCA
MFLSQRYIPMVKVLSIFLLACFATCQESENKRAVTEHQLLNDRGGALQGLKRLMWLHNAMMGVHTATDRGHVSRAHIMWTSPKNQDPADIYDNIRREEISDVIKQLLLGRLEEAPLSAMRKTNVLQYLKNVKDSQDIQDLSDLFQAGDQDGKRNLSAQT